MDEGILENPIFKAADLSVQTTNNPMMRDANYQSFAFPGVVFSGFCQICEREIKVGLLWAEIQMMLDGKKLPNVVKSGEEWDRWKVSIPPGEGWNGWKVSAPCKCGQRMSIFISEHRLEEMMSKEISRKLKLPRILGLERKKRMAVLCLSEWLEELRLFVKSERVTSALDFVRGFSVRDIISKKK